MTAQLHPDTVQTVTRIVMILTHGVDAVVVGYYRGGDLIYVARVRNGFVPASRRQVFARLKPLIISKCPFVNLPEIHKGRWGEGLTATDMQKCAWVRPQLVARIEFLEWTESDHLRHSKFAGLLEIWAELRKEIIEHMPLEMTQRAETTCAEFSARHESS